MDDLMELWPIFAAFVLVCVLVGLGIYVHGAFLIPVVVGAAFAVLLS